MEHTYQILKQREIARVDKPQKPVSSPVISRSAWDIDDLISNWRNRSQKWRTEPEIDRERQRHLTALLRTLPPDEQDFHPFLDEKLTRADVEWLLVNSLRDQGKLLERVKEILENSEIARTMSLGALRDLRKQMYEISYQAQYVDLRGANLAGVDLTNLPLDTILLQDADLTGADLRKSLLHHAHLERAMLDRAFLQGVSLTGAHLEGARLDDTHLEGANLSGAHLEGARLVRTHLEGATLNGALLDRTTKLEKILLSDKVHGSAILHDTDWNGVNLSEVDWSQMKILGDESWAIRVQKRNEEMLQSHPETKREDKKRWLGSSAVVYKRAARTSRRLAIALQEQGIADEARSFAYRSYILQRKALRLERNIPGYLGSLFLDFLSGYGYKPLKSFMAYLLIIGIFMSVYHLAGPHLGWMESFVISMSAFHGRGFFPGTFSPGDPLALAGALEALVGLIIEVTLITTLTQRLFSK